MLELEHHVELPAIVARVFLRLIDRDARCFTDRQQVIVAQYLTIHFLQELMHPRTVAYIRRQVAIPIVLYRAVRE